MSLSINNVIYLFGAIISIFTLFISRSKMPSFFSRRRILKVLQKENKEFDDVLSKLRKWKYSDYDIYIYVPVLVIILVIYGFENNKISLYDDFLILFWVFILFVIFNYIVVSKQNSLFHKNADITKSLQKIVDSLYISRALLLWIIFLFIFFVSFFSFLLNNNILENLFQISLLSIAGISIVAYFLFINTILIGSIEQNYLTMKKNRHELPEIYMKIKMKNTENALSGSLDSLRFSSITIDDTDGFRFSIEYNKIETIGVKSKLQNQ